ncbi:MFS transporter [Legionella sp. PATHC038]|uniref:MFS transporter n=1 Tax=Legionella sheltonii TaxID=2992041 RepID=UPI0022431F07|nr:MFS transporter [Legionella sp. PATHC038]MCW8400892.1 MFS transporter [Legionella sp. PATHC038]
MRFFNPNLKLIWCLLLGIVCVNSAKFMCLPFLILFLNHNTHFSLWISGLVCGIAPFCSIFGGFIGGQLSDKYGRIPLLYISIFTSACIFLLLGLSWQINSRYLQLILIGTLNGMFGLFSSFFQPVALALISELVDKEHRELFFNLRYAAMNIGAVFGPLLAVYLGVTLSPIAFYIAGFMYFSFGCFLYAILLKEPRQLCRNKQSNVSLSATLRAISLDRRLLNFILFNIVFALCYSQIDSTLAQFISQQIDDGVRVYSLTIALNALFVLIGQLPIFLLCRRIPKHQAVFCGCFLFFLGCLGFSCCGNKASYFYYSILIITVGELFIFPIAFLFVDDMAPSHLKGSYFGALAFRELGLALGPVLGGVLLESFGGQILFIIIGGLSLISYFFVYVGEYAKPVMKQSLGRAFNNME